MALWELLGAARRHLIILVLGGMVTVAALLMVHRHPGLFQSEVSVVFVAPHGYETRNPLVGQDYNLIAVADVVKDMANKSANIAPTASTVSLAGRGVTDGFLVSLPNFGNQWVAEYDSPILDVQAVGYSQQETQANMQQALTAIRTSVAKIQQDAGIAPGRQITTSLNPGVPVLSFSRGRPSRSMIATSVLGAGITLTIIFLYDERLGGGASRGPRRRLLRRSSPSPA